MTTTDSDTTTIAAYLDARRKGCRAIDALRIAKRGEPTYRIDDDVCRFTDTDTGFDVVFTVDLDIYADPMDWLGEWTDEPGADRLENPGANWHTDEYSNRLQGNRRVFGYFLPATTESDHYKYLHRAHGKAEARRIARESVRRDLEHAIAYQAYTLSCDVSLNGITLGSASLHDIDCTNASHAEMTEYLSDCAADVAYEAIHEATDALEMIGEHRTVLAGHQHTDPTDETWTQHTPAVPWSVGTDSLGTAYGPRCPAGCLTDGVVTASRPAAIRCRCTRCDVEWTETIATAD